MTMKTQHRNSILLRAVSDALDLPAMTPRERVRSYQRFDAARITARNVAQGRIEPCDQRSENMPRVV